ncbi:alanine racemase [bacterium]|nr:alanine racemase [bacterium]
MDKVNHTEIPHLRYNTAMKSRRIRDAFSHISRAANPIRVIRTAMTKLSRERHPYEPLITVEISRSAILHNLAEFSRLIHPDPARGEQASEKKAIVPVLKSNAYGHGLIPVASILEKASGIPFFIIDTYFEALALRRDGIETPLLIIGYTPPQTIVENRLRSVSFVVTSIDALRELVDLKKATGKSRRAKSQPKIHLKIDTGMHRQGILPEEIDEMLALTKHCTGIIFEGICSHFASADGASVEHVAFTETQIALWNSIVTKVRGAVPTLTWWHVSNTAGKSYEHSIMSNASRLGIGLYGIHQDAELSAAIDKQVDIRPALTMKTIVSGVKNIKKGDHVGYSGTFVAPHDMTIATIPAGYFEGIDRGLSSKGFVEVTNDTRSTLSSTSSPVLCPIIGRVSMNITTFDVTALAKETGTNIRRGDTVIVISDDTSRSNSIEQIARLVGTIPYVIAIHIPGHLRRVIVD